MAEVSRVPSSEHTHKSQDVITIGGNWATVRSRRTVLAIVHNITAATRLLDVLLLLGHDDRIQIFFTIPGSSAFTDGTDRFLAEHGIRVYEPEALGDDPKIDLVISASFGDELSFRPAPKVVLPHGVGYNKYLNRKTGTGNVFGLSAEWLYDKHGDLVADLLVLSHEEQLDRLRRACPDATDIALVAGDPCLDRMIASLPLRAVYRRAFGVTEGQRLVLVSSTWGEQSLLGRHPEAIRDMARLPIDEYRVVVALHPNIGAWHSSWQVARWLDDCERAGVTVLPPLEGWRAALVAADLVLGDHGSVPFYGAALGRPVLLACAPEDTMAPDSAVGRFLRAAPRWKPGQDLAASSDAVIREHDPDALRPVTDLASSAVGESASLLRKAFYRLLDLPEPSHPADVRTVPVPSEGQGEVSAQLVRAELIDDTTVGITRHPAELMSIEVALPVGTHVVSDTEVPRRRMLELAEIIVVPDPSDGPALLHALPGCLLATGQHRDGAWEVVTREGQRIRFHGAEGIGAGGRLCASMIHAWLTDGRTLTDLPARMSLRHGPRRVELTVRIG